jgi:metal-responsive CopG/Arc/MetJ family transcriptional regulator
MTVPSTVNLNFYIENFGNTKIQQIAGAIVYLYAPKRRQLETRVMQFTFAYDPTLIITHQHMALLDRHDAQLKRCAYHPLHARSID